MANTFVSFLDATGDSIVSGPVPVESFVPRSANLFPKMPNGINDEGWELWEFDGISADGETSVATSFYRDARSLEEGGFHVDVNAIWPDGTKWGGELYFAQSVISALGGDYPHDGQLHGVWKSGKEGGASASFSISSDCSSAIVHFSSPGRVTGTIMIRALGDNLVSRLPETEGAALLSPSVHYLFPMGPAAATANLSFVMQDEASGTSASERQLTLDEDEAASGAMVRGWSCSAWPRFMIDAYYVCGKIGPYHLQLIRIVSTAADGHKSHVAARLYCGNELVCAANEAMDMATAETQDAPQRDTLVVDKVMDGKGVAGAFLDKNTGYLIEFRQGGGWRSRKRWHFELSHKRAWWSDYTSDRGTGKSGFIETIRGGSDGEIGYQGVGGGGQLQLPG
ncbi:uncharacterized protein E0L32_012147 [Thyridium curvatum]|uniref:Uncharacterized protein n=1 Tax=Thyridium curvatum TaxID=1093900 RepID=A0A507BFL3_9PEZI|nr:uncharacterized protein E0L32_012147 [Thyridium curvatum]TPX17554.1 hypothetical protein E0L32_012147 [Thyridium curvatum]